jgi:uncharacterized membrane protein (DUF4010 family)
MGLGALTAAQPALAVGLGVAMTVLLASKESLHRFVRETVTDQERTDALKFFVVAFIVLPLLPSGPLGPYDVWVPQRVWLLVVLITGIGWVGYAATRILGTRRGLLIAGLAGGFVSATATTASMAARNRHGGASLSATLAATVLASVATLVQLVLVTTIAEPRVAARLVLAVVVGSVVLLGEAWWLSRRSARSTMAGEQPGRPFALLPALVLAGVISLVLLLATWMDERFGPAGTTAATATGALADLHAAGVAVATLVREGKVGVDAAIAAIGAGLVTNTVGKLVVATVGGGARFAGALALCFLPAAVAVAAALVLV